MRELRVLVTQQQCKITELQTDNAELKLQMNELKREVQVLKVSSLHHPVADIDHVKPGKPFCRNICARFDRATREA